MLRAAGPVAPARPMVSLHQPSDTVIQAFLDLQRLQPFLYRGVGSSRHVPPAGYVVDHRRVCLGTGQHIFEAACAALRCWQMFQVSRVQLCWPTTGIEPGAVVGILASWAGLWFLNACRIVYVLDEISSMRRVGFAYGTYHGGQRVQRKAALQPPDAGIPQPDQPVAWPGEGPQVIPYRVIAVPFDAEALLPALRMPWQCAVSKANATHGAALVQHIHNAAGIQEPQTTPRRQDAYDGTGLDTRGGPAELHPSYLEHLPTPQSCTGRFKGTLTLAQTDAAMVHDIACRWYVARTPDAAVWKGLGTLAVEEGMYGYV